MDAQADLCLRWAHISKGTFAHIVAELVTYSCFFVMLVLKVESIDLLSANEFVILLGERSAASVLFLD